jgi:hypothetical protein
VVVGHSTGPSAKTLQGVGGVFGDLGGEHLLTIRGLGGEVGLEQLNGLLIDVILIIVGE